MSDVVQPPSPEDDRERRYAVIQRYIDMADVPGLVAWMQSEGLASGYVEDVRDESLAVVHSRALTVVNGACDVAYGRPLLLQDCVPLLVRKRVRKRVHQLTDCRAS